MTSSGFAASRLALPGGLSGPGWVEVADERIVRVWDGPAPAGVTDLGDVVLAPGFVDIHQHGGGGVAHTAGADAARTVAATHLAHGTTSLMASLVTDTPDRLVEQIGALAPLVESGELLGVHLEGPWLSPLHGGAHDPELLRDPRPDEVAEVLDAVSGVVGMVTLAAECPGGFDAVAACAARGVIGALGHSDATYAEATAAFDAGSPLVTHLFNASRPIHQREPGWMVAALERPEIYVELIADGVHVHPALIGNVFAIKPDRVVLVTDAMAAAGSADGDYDLGPLRVEVRAGVARLAEPDGRGAIAGSTLTLDRAVRFCVRECGVPLTRALAAATRIPADAIRRPDLGRLSPGACADLVALDTDLTVTRVVRAGDIVH